MQQLCYPNMGKSIEKLGWAAPESMMFVNYPEPTPLVEVRNKYYWLPRVVGQVFPDFVKVVDVLYSRLTARSIVANK